MATHSSRKELNLHHNQPPKTTHSALDVLQSIKTDAADVDWELTPRNTVDFQDIKDKTDEPV